jgi:hypothetical protein
MWVTVDHRPPTPIGTRDTQTVEPFVAPRVPMDQVKVLLAAPVFSLIGLALLPVVLASGDAPPPMACAYGVNVDAVLTTIRTMESGENYAAQARGSTASGAYQFLDSTWSGYGAYARAADAPADVQDALARQLVDTILEEHGGDVGAVPVVWYIGHVPPDGSPEWNAVPAPEAGNVLTPREYQTKWLAKFASVADLRAGEPGAAWSPCTGSTVEQVVPGWSLPGPRELIDANLAALSQPHHDYPAWDWIIPTGTPIYAVRGGKVVSVQDWPHNWWDQGCGDSPSGACRTCGVGVTIAEADGTRWTYCHGSALTTSMGSEVVAGQQILWSGNTGRSGTPHLHLEIRDGVVQICPQPVLVALAAGHVPRLERVLSGTCWF